MSTCLNKNPFSTFCNFLFFLLSVLVGCPQCCKLLLVASVWQGGKSVSQHFSPAERVEVKQRLTARGHEARGDFRGSQTDRFRLERSGSPDWRPCSQHHTWVADATDRSGCQQESSTRHCGHVSYLHFMVSGCFKKQTQTRTNMSSIGDNGELMQNNQVQQILGSHS